MAGVGSATSVGLGRAASGGPVAPVQGYWCYLQPLKALPVTPSSFGGDFHLQSTCPVWASGTEDDILQPSGGLCWG